ncbi:VOC family protein [Vibrio brasiliensis]|uniref:VOC family protein n=1 Tax=Vibrio brasiliensis TaxID=170652 RepID=UPI001EFE297C|nr:VOC family protein [Vibrio brasiliensis]MCG9753458.1 VOC family protein [Vibrio brasiliensis]
MLTFHHVGIAVDDINDSYNQYKLHIGESIESETDVVYDGIQDAYLKLVTLSSGINIEFISGNMVRNLIKRGMNVYHTCYETDDFMFDSNNMLRNGAVALSSSAPAELFGGRLVQFFMTQYGIVELLESE